MENKELWKKRPARSSHFYKLFSIKGLEWNCRHGKPKKRREAGSISLSLAKDTLSAYVAKNYKTGGRNRMKRGAD